MARNNKRHTLRRPSNTQAHKLLGLPKPCRTCGGDSQIGMQRPVWGKLTYVWYCVPCYTDTGYSDGDILVRLDEPEPESEPAPKRSGVKVFA